MERKHQTNEAFVMGLCNTKPLGAAWVQVALSVYSQAIVETPEADFKEEQWGMIYVPSWIGLAKIFCDGLGQHGPNCRLGEEQKRFLKSFVKRQMTFCQYGALSHIYLLTAIENYAKSVTTGANELDVSAEWVHMSQLVLDKINAWRGQA